MRRVPCRLQTQELKAKLQELFEALDEEARAVYDERQQEDNARSTDKNRAIWEHVYTTHLRALESHLLTECYDSSAYYFHKRYS